MKFEVGSFTPTGPATQTITLADGTLTPQAIMCWSRLGATVGGFNIDDVMSMGFATRRGGTTQSGGWGITIIDNANPSSNAYIQHTRLLLVDSHITIDLTGFAAGSFSVSYPTAPGSSLVGYAVWGDIDDAIVINHTMDAVAGAEVVTGAGFQPTVALFLDANGATPDSATSGHTVASFGFASSATLFRSFGITATLDDTMTASMNWNKAFHTDSCVERLSRNADTQDAQWDLDSFDSDGISLGVVNAPGNTDAECAILLMKGGTWEAGSKAKITTTGTDTFTLANSALTPLGVLLFTTRQTATGITAGDIDWCFGASDLTRHRCIGGTGVEAIATQADSFFATDTAIEELTGGATPAETSLATVSAFNTGNFTLNWSVNGGSAALIGFLAFGNTVAGTWPGWYPSKGGWF